MNPASTSAPPPRPLRHRPLPVEPVLFAALMMALTVAIHLGLPGSGSRPDAIQQAPAAQPAPATQSAEAPQAAPTTSIAQVH